MTVIEFYRRDGVPCGIKAQGHSGFARAGGDIVCAAVSVLVQTLELGLTDVLGLKVENRVDPETALIELHWDASGKSREVSVLSETIFRSLKETARSYGNYVKFVEVAL
ncbi:MAG: ribosomal-processing cysteine protease Prp [Pyramidobacter sp.]